MCNIVRDDDWLGPSLILIHEGYAVFMSVLSGLIAEMAEMTSIGVAGRKDTDLIQAFFLNSHEKYRAIVRETTPSLPESEFDAVFRLIGRIFDQVEDRLDGRFPDS